MFGVKGREGTENYKKMEDSHDCYRNGNAKTDGFDGDGPPQSGAKGSACKGVRANVIAPHRGPGGGRTPNERSLSDLPRWNEFKQSPGWHNALFGSDRFRKDPRRRSRGRSLV